MSQTQDAPPGRRRGLTSIRSKLLLALAVPVLVVAGITAVQATDAQNTLNSTEDEVSLALAAGGPTTVATALLDERNLTALDALGIVGGVELARFEGIDDAEKVGEARKLTDAALSTFRASVVDSTDRVRGSYLPVLDEIEDRLDVARDEADAFPVDDRGLNREAGAAAVEVYDAFSAILGELITANEAAIADLDDAELHNRANSIAAQTRTGNLTSLMLRAAALPALGVADADLPEMQELLTDYRLAEQRARAGVASDPDAAEVVDAYYDRDSTQIFLRLHEHVAHDHPVGAGDLSKYIAIPADPTTHPNDGEAWTAARDSVQQRGDELVDDARNSRNVAVLLFLLATLSSIVVAILIARSIARPLLSISAQADTMARERLPAAVGSVLNTPVGQNIVEPELEPITVSSRDEVADVAGSINVVQQRVLDLAVEQAAQRRNFADTFLNLGRRVQGLVARQLDFITELEDAEDDPNVLADLFRLDHLATRIRRNAESLVVLAGVTRRQRRGEPAPVLDAMRTALGEVDEYTRVDIGDVDHARLPMSVASDLAHILAELIENGLNFSPPDTYVEVTGRRSDRGYDITVVDHGIGMDAEQVDTANRRLSGNESFTVAPSRYMGHFVAGHLATGLGITVSLASNPSGTVATVIVPPGLLVKDPIPEGDPPPGGDTPSEESIPAAAATGEVEEGGDDDADR